MVKFLISVCVTRPPPDGQQDPVVEKVFLIFDSFRDRTLYAATLDTFTYSADNTNRPYVAYTLATIGLLHESRYVENVGARNKLLRSLMPVSRQAPQ